MKKKEKILIVDDNELNRSMLIDMLGQEEYEMIEAVDGIDAISALKRYSNEIALVLLDIVMPRMDGFGVLEFMNKGDVINEIPVIMISADSNSASIDKAYDLGASEYINRPFDMKTVCHRVKNTIMLFEKQRELEGMVTEQIIEKEEDSNMMIEILSHIVEFRNGDSGLHVLHIRLITDLLLKALIRKTDLFFLDSRMINLITNASALHDIGKISIPEEILNKPGRLTTEEFEIMKRHTVIGYEMLDELAYKNSTLVQVAKEICRWHHERWDGRGYPDGLVGESIPISAQVVALADVYDALTSERVYKKAYSHQKAIEMIVNGECGVFNPLLLKCLVENQSQLEELLNQEVNLQPKDELYNITKNLIKNGEVSNRTLVLLDKERTKHLFFASMSKEIQFEYSFETNIMTISNQGTKILNLEPVMVDPFHDGRLVDILGEKTIKDIRHSLSKVTHDDPVVDKNYLISYNGIKRWWRMIIRPIWESDDSDKITEIIGKCVDIHEEVTRQKELFEIATHDFLTGIYNRQQVELLINEILAKNPDKKYAFLLLDLDSFKSANDDHGHLFGDNVLKAFAYRMEDSTDPKDIIGRIGGDEFCIFIKYDTHDELQKRVEAIFSQLNNKSYYNFELTLSLGVSLYPENGKNVIELIHKADQALYSVKYTGKNCFRFYDDSMNNLLATVVSSIDGE